MTDLWESIYTASKSSLFLGKSLAVLGGVVVLTPLLFGHFDLRQNLYVGGPIVMMGTLAYATGHAGLYKARRKVHHRRP
jgi:hypothetical protein